MSDATGKVKPDKEDEAVEVEKKNFLQKFISYFKYNPRLDKRLNYSLLFNSYYVVRGIPAEADSRLDF